MKNLLHMLVLAMSLSASVASAQTPEKLVSEIRAAAEDSCVTVRYSMTATVDDAVIEDSGTVVAQDDLWHLKGETIEIYTSGDGTWILHMQAKEAIVEPQWTYDDLEAFYRTLLSSSGNVVNVRISSKELSEKKPVSSFVPVTGSDWVVTDLR